MVHSCNKVKSTLLILISIGILIMSVACENIAGTKIQQAELPLSPQIATVKSLYASSICYPAAYCLYVELKPTNNAVAGKNYIVDLYEKGNLRDTTTVQWNQPEINVLLEKSITFQHIRQEEYNAYRGKDISHIFSVKIHKVNHTVTALTQFITLLSWGIPTEEIEKVIGEKFPGEGYGDLLEYSHRTHKDLETLITALQKLADKYQ